MCSSYVRMPNRLTAGATVRGDPSAIEFEDQRFTQAMRRVFAKAIALLSVMDCTHSSSE